jgi:hypothetical protein
MDKPSGGLLLNTIDMSNGFSTIVVWKCFTLTFLHTKNSVIDREKELYAQSGSFIFSLCVLWSWW